MSRSCTSDRQPLPGAFVHLRSLLIRPRFIAVLYRSSATLRSSRPSMGLTHMTLLYHGPVQNVRLIYSVSGTNHSLASLFAVLTVRSIAKPVAVQCQYSCLLYVNTSKHTGAEPRQNVVHPKFPLSALSVRARHRSKHDDVFKRIRISRHVTKVLKLSSSYLSQ
jgi:hypothetical protein